MRSKRSPLAIAAAAVIAVPPASAQPMQLTPPAETQSQAGNAEPPSTPLPRDLSPAAPASLSAPAPASTAEAQAPPPTPVSPPPPVAPPPAPPRMASEPNATVSVGVQEEYTRLAFRFAAPTTVTPLLQNNRLELRFSRAADIDIAELRATPPRYVREVRRISAAGAPVRLALTLDPGIRQRHFIDGNRVVVDLLAPDEAAREVAAAAAASGQEAPPVPARPPVSGTARVQLVEEANTTRVEITWNAPARAAAFRRGEAIWLLFDGGGAIDLRGVARAGRRHQDMEVVRGDGVIGLRIPAPPDIVVSAAARDNSWVFTLGARASAGSPAALERITEANGQARLVAHFGREGVVRWISDPEIGDRIAVALLGGPARGIDTRRATVEAAVLPAAHGAVIEPRADGVTATLQNGDLTVSRGNGLLAALPPQSAAEAAADPNAAMLAAALANNGEAPAAATPGMTLAQVRERIDELTRRAAAEGVQDGAPIEARMELARFLLQNELAAEALGALRIVAINQGDIVETDPEYRLMRGAANVMMGRANAALADLNASSLGNNPSAALWRGYAASLRNEWSDARRELERGASAMEEHPPAWRARFQLALANAALELNDYAAAEAAASAAAGQAGDQHLRLEAQLVQARVAQERGDAQRALQLLDALSAARDEEVAVRATLEAIRVRRSTGVMQAINVIEPLEALRFRWRGDALELAIVGELGQAYSELNRWRDALATMRIAADRFPSEVAARQLRADMTTLFERLFLDGEADQLEPIQALGLFYEFSDLTPVGPNGDRIVRLLAGRLVNVDLLEQAAQLLQHQVDERLQGMSKAQVASDLAAIYLMDHKPDQALVALSSTRLPNMPQALLADRRILEARALLDLGRLDGAVELVERDRSEEAQSVRAEAAWRSRDWDRASSELRTLIGMRNRAQPLDAHGRQIVLRAAIAMTLAGNEDGVRALYREYAGDMANTDDADSFEVVASGVQADGAAIRDVARSVARTDLLDRFMQRLRAHMTAEANQSAAAAPGQPSAQQTAPNAAAPNGREPQAGA